jgi:hypothetical protein
VIKSPGTSPVMLCPASEDRVHVPSSEVVAAAVTEAVVEASGGSSSSSIHIAAPGIMATVAVAFPRVQVLFITRVDSI